MKHNEKLRKFARSKGVCQWQIANELGVSESTFTKWMRKQLPEDIEKQAFEAVKRLGDV